MICCDLFGYTKSMLWHSIYYSPGHPKQKGPPEPWVLVVSITTPSTTQERQGLGFRVERVSCPGANESVVLA